MTEAETVEALRAKLPGMILDLLEENGVSDLPASIENHRTSFVGSGKGAKRRATLFIVRQ